MPPYRNYIYEYHAKITSGEIIAGKWIKKIYEIIINGLQKQEYFFNAKAANKAIRFIENFCHHSKGRNDLIKLELWQKAIVSVIFGIQDAEKIRIFREIFIVIGRKNGKSLFASAIIAYMAYLEPEYGQEIYCLAPKLDQAALVYDGFYQMVQAEDELAELAKKRRSDIYIAESNTVIKPIMNMTITEFIEAAAHNKIIQLVVLAIVCDTVFGVLRAIKEKKFNSCAGIDGAIRKVGMLISLVFMLAIDVLIKINLIGFIPEQARTYLGLDTVGVAEFFALLYIAYEVVSIFKNMALCGLPVKKVWEKVREFLAKYTDELPDTDELDGDSTTGSVEEHRTQER